MSRAQLVAACVGATAAALLVGATLAGGSGEDDGALDVSSQPVLRSTSVCSNVGGEPGATSQIGMFAIPGVPEPPIDGAEIRGVTALPLLGPDAEVPEEPFAELAERSVRLVTEASATDAASYGIRATGVLSPGVVAEQWARGNGTDLRGLATGSCGAPAREFWFVGASGSPEQRARLVLTNPTATRAAVNLTLWNENGPIDVAGTDNLGLPPNSEEVLLLEAIAPDSTYLAIQVVTTTGRVVAAIDHRETTEDGPAGMSLIPAAATPAETVVIPGVPGAGSRSLRIVAPGDNDAIVRLEVLSPDGPYQPVGLDVLTVPAGRVLELRVDESMGTDPTALRLISDEPITAAMRVAQGSDNGSPDVAFTSATPALAAGPLASVFGIDDDALDTTLVFSAIGDAGGSVIVRTLDGAGLTVDEALIDLRAGSTQSLQLTRPEDSPWTTTVVEVAADNTVVGARLVTGEDDNGRLLDLMPLTAPQTTVRVPDISAELRP